MADIFYTKSHEWVRFDADAAVVGITDYAQEQLGDIVYVEPIEIGATFAKGDQCCVVESVKAASEVYAPIGGEVVAINETLEDDPAKVNADPLGDGWFFKMKPSDAEPASDLMDKKAYEKHIAGEG
jgi:glycine cleavage system H protein